MEENKKLTWIEIQKLIEKPVWENKRKCWRVLDGYKEERYGKYVSFTDEDKYISLKNLELYKNEQEVQNTEEEDDE